MFWFFLRLGIVGGLGLFLVSMLGLGIDLAY
jgi:hypothetical protein